MIEKGIRVAVIFEPGRKHPKVQWFDLNGEKATVKEECYFWQSYAGAAQINHYSLNTDKGLFELQFNSLSQQWSLKNPA